MSQEQAIRFMLYMKGDKVLKREYEAIVREYKNINITTEQMVSIIRERILPLAKDIGHEISPEELIQLFDMPDAGTLTDDELAKAVGGRGQFSRYYPHPTFRNGEWVQDKFEDVYSCEKAADDASFKYFYDAGPGNGCPSYQHVGIGLDVGMCIFCKHFRLSYGR
jgi:hypothetical protein